MDWYQLGITWANDDLYEPWHHVVSQLLMGLSLSILKPEYSENKANDIAVGALAPCVARSSAAIVLMMWDQLVLM